MAERRMFSSKIVCSDAFTEMPFSAQALYFQLNMEADDDGFLNNARRVMRTIEATEDDLNLLFEKRFVLGFQNGVIVIKHWRMNNQIRKDRYTPTQYQSEFNSLDIKDDGAYTEKDSEDAVGTLATTWQPLGNHLATQNRLGKDRLVKVSKEEGEMSDSTESDAPPSYKQIVDLFHSICISFPKIRSLSDARKKAIKARMNTYSLDEFRTMFENAEASSFLKGKNDRNWTATFDWLIKDANMAKVLEGNYADKQNRFGRKEKLPGWFKQGERQLDDDELRAIDSMFSEDDQKEADQLRRELQEAFGGK
jgi:hypothetical protein